MTLQRASVVVFLVPLVAASCGYRKYGGGGSHGGTPVYLEQEINDSPANANWVSSVYPGDYFAIRGHVSDFAGDWFDGFAFYSPTAVDVEFFLTADDPAADLDLCWYDPVAGAHVACWETTFNPEQGVLPLYAGEDFHLVVSPFWGSSYYTLEVYVHALGYAPASTTVPEGEAPAKGERQVPLERYHRAEEPLAEAADEELAPLAVGRLIELDGEDGSLRSRPFEVTRQGLRVGPVSIGVGGS